MQYGVYEVRNQINGKVYFGKYKNKPNGRWYRHKNVKTQSVIAKAIRKAGLNNFTFSVVFHGLTDEEAGQLEQDLIHLHNSDVRAYGYNRTKGGGGITGYVFSDEARKKIGESSRRALTGRQFSPEHRAALSSAKKGRSTGPKSAETRAKISEGNKGKNSGKPSHMKGKHHTDEMRELLSRLATKREARKKRARRRTSSPA